jgi:hypothetical protein
MRVIIVHVGRQRLHPFSLGGGGVRDFPWNRFFGFILRKHNFALSPIKSDFISVSTHG